MSRSAIALRPVGRRGRPRVLRPAPRGRVARGGVVAALVLWLLVHQGPAAQPPPGPTLYRAPQPVDAYVARYPRLAVVAREPQFTWLGEQDTADTVRRLVRAADGQVLPLVLYAIPKRDLIGGHSAGGTPDTEAYGRWVGGVAAALGTAPAIVVVEPDAVGQSLAMPSAERAARLLAIRRTVDVLVARAPRTRVYLEASAWIEPAVMAPLLWEANVGAAAGVALNVADHLTDAAALGYGEALSARLGGRHYLIDSSRNGRGPGTDPAAWCNVPGRGIGRPPGAAPADHPRCDGFFWVKRPGVSDGPCHGGPPAGTFWPAGALELVANAG